MNNKPTIKQNKNVAKTLQLLALISICGTVWKVTDSLFLEISRALFFAVAFGSWVFSDLITLYKSLLEKKIGSPHWSSVLTKRDVYTGLKLMNWLGLYIVLVLREFLPLLIKLAPYAKALRQESLQTNLIYAACGLILSQIIVVVIGKFYIWITD